MNQGVNFPFIACKPTAADYNMLLCLSYVIQFQGLLDCFLKFGLLSTIQAFKSVVISNIRDIQVALTQRYTPKIRLIYDSLSKRPLKSLRCLIR